MKAGVAVAALGGAAGPTSLAGFSIAGVAGLILSLRRLAVAGAIAALAAIEGLGRLGAPQTRRRPR